MELPLARLRRPMHGGIGMSEITCTRGKGFRIAFDNGFAVSVQFGPGTYSSNRDMSFDADIKGISATTVETAIIDPAGELIKRDVDDFDTVQGHQSIEQMLELLNHVASLEVKRWKA